MAEKTWVAAADGYMPDGTPIYIQTRSGIPPSSLQLQVYAALADPSKEMSKEVIECLRKSGGGLRKNL